jgi:hypothetical protein
MPRTKRKDKKNKKRYLSGGVMTTGELLQKEGFDQTTRKSDYLSVDTSPGFLNFEERYAHMPGSEGGYSAKEYRKFKDLERQGIPVDSDRYDYLKTVHDERTRATGTTALNVGAIVLGAYTGNQALMQQGVTNIGNYAMGEMEETKAGGQNPYTGEYLGSDPTGQEIQFEEELAGQLTTFVPAIGQGSGSTKSTETSQSGNMVYGPAPSKTTRQIQKGKIPSEATTASTGKGSSVNTLLGALSGYGTSSSKQGSRLRYIPRKYDYIKGNTFGKQ